jgi:hypothetical protein
VLLPISRQLIPIRRRIRPRQAAPSRGIWPGVIAAERARSSSAGATYLHACAVETRPWRGGGAGSLDDARQGARYSAMAGSKVGGERRWLGAPLESRRRHLAVRSIARGLRKRGQRPARHGYAPDRPFRWPRYSGSRIRIP